MLKERGWIMGAIKVIEAGRLEIGEIIIRIEQIYGLDKAHIWLAGFCSGLTTMLGKVDQETQQGILKMIDNIGVYYGLTLEQRTAIKGNFSPGDGDGRN